MAIERKRLLEEGDPTPSVHNLRSCDIEPARAGDSIAVEELGTRTFHERKQRYRKAQRLIALLLEDDVRLDRRVRAAQPAPFPSPGAGGGRSSGTSDPTARAALRPRILDPAERVQLEFDEALKHLRRADSARRHAFEMDRAEKTLSEEGVEELEPDIEFCPNCAKAGVRNERGKVKDVGKDSPFCRECHCFKRDHGIDRPRWVVRKHEKTGKTTSRDVAEALRLAQPQKPRQ